MIEAVEPYIERQEKRERFRLDTLAALDDYDRTGLHLTGEEVDEWLARLEAGEDAYPPECHAWSGLGRPNSTWSVYTPFSCQ